MDDFLKVIVFLTFIITGLALYLVVNMSKKVDDIQFQVKQVNSTINSWDIHLN